jgi:FHA domain
MPIVIEIRSMGRPAEIREFLHGRLTIGRQVGNIALTDPQASAKHAELTVTSRGVTYLDLKSTNGSYLENGQKITGPLNWLPDVIIRIGSSSLKLVSFERPDFGPSGTLMVPTEGMAGKPPAEREAAPLAPTPPPPAVVASPPVSLHAEQKHEQPRIADSVAAPLSLPAPAVPVSMSAVSRTFQPEAQTEIELGAFGLLRSCVREYRGHAFAGFRVLGPLALLLGALSSLATLAGWESLSGWLVAFTSLGYAALFFLFGWGAQAEFAMRVYAGVPVTPRQIWRLQTRRLTPWLVELLPSVLVLTSGFVFTLVMFGPMLTPVYMIERVNGLRISTRSVELLALDWKLGLAPLLIVIGCIVCVLLGVSAALECVPVAGNGLSALFGPAFLALALPFVSYVQFSAYGATRKYREGVDVVELIRAEFA